MSLLFLSRSISLLRNYCMNVVESIGIKIKVPEKSYGSILWLREDQNAECGTSSRAWVLRAHGQAQEKLCESVDVQRG